MRISVVRPPWDEGGAGPGAKAGAMLGDGIGAELDRESSESSRNMISAGTRLCVGWIGGCCTLGVLYTAAV